MSGHYERAQGHASRSILCLRDALGSALLVSLAIIILLIGSPLPDPRLTFAGLSLPPFLFGCGVLIATLVPRCRIYLPLAFAWLAPLALGGISLFWTSSPDYGAYKLFNLIASVAIVLPLLYAYVEKFGERGLALIWILLMGVLLAFTVIYKVRFGFFDRQVLYLMNGPIVFARLMGVAAIFSIFYLRGWLRLFAFVIFLLAVMWTMSKGPILALAGATVIAGVFLLPRGQRLRFGGALALGMGVAAFAIWRLSPDLELGRLAVLIDLATGNVGNTPAEFGSVGVRILIFARTASLVMEQPLGVGLGAWSTAIDTNFGLYYPHNIFLELWSESGLVLGTIATIPFLAFLTGSRRFPALYGIALFLLAAQMVSGDLLDARYLLVFSALACSATGAAARSYARDLSAES